MSNKEPQAMVKKIRLRRLIDGERERERERERGRVGERGREGEGEGGRVRERERGREGEREGEREIGEILHLVPSLSRRSAWDIHP